MAPIKGNPLPPSTKARGWITALTKELQAKDDNSLLNSDQYSNRNHKKVEKEDSLPSNVAISLDEGGSVLGKHYSGIGSFLHVCVCSLLT